MWRGFKAGLVVLMFVAGSCLPGRAQALAHDEAGWDHAEFVEVLSPYGEWIQLPPFGLVWRPHSHYVGAGFIPYASFGRWVYTDVGWVFLSDLPWGWATFHYGRWARHRHHGWIWVPGLVWGPAWVEWRFGGGYVGWAPMLPPGFGGWGGYWYHDPFWCFTRTHDFTRPHVRRHVHGGSPRTTGHLVDVTRPVPPRTGRGNPAWPVGPVPDRIVLEDRRPIPTLELQPPPEGRVAPPTMRDVGGSMTTPSPTDAFKPVPSAPPSTGDVDARRPRPSRPDESAPSPTEREEPGVRRMPSPTEPPPPADTGEPGVRPMPPAEPAPQRPRADVEEEPGVRRMPTPSEPAPERPRGDLEDEPDVRRMPTPTQPAPGRPRPDTDEPGVRRMPTPTEPAPERPRGETGVQPMPPPSEPAPPPTAAPEEQRGSELRPMRWVERPAPPSEPSEPQPAPRTQEPAPQAAERPAPDRGGTERHGSDRGAGKAERPASEAPAPSRPQHHRPDSRRAP